MPSSSKIDNKMRCMTWRAISDMRQALRGAVVAHQCRVVRTRIKYVSAASFGLGHPRARTLRLRVRRWCRAGAASPRVRRRVARRGVALGGRRDVQPAADGCRVSLFRGLLPVLRARRSFTQQLDEVLRRLLGPGIYCSSRHPTHLGPSFRGIHDFP
jgi:hypothetical protein